MNRALVVPTLVVVVAMSAAAQTPRESPRSGDGDVVTMRGCVSGSLLKTIERDPATVAGTLTASDRYRMIGSKTVRAEIKKANRKYVAVTGRVQAGPRAMVKGKKMGGTTIGIGVTQGTTSSTEVPYTPTIEVDAVDVLAEKCGD